MGVVAVLSAACATRPGAGFLSPVVDSVVGATNHTLLIATTRERDARPGTFFNGERGKSLAGDENRVGNDGDIEELVALGATVIDLANVNGDDPTNTDKFVQLATVAPERRTVLGQTLLAGITAATGRSAAPC